MNSIPVILGSIGLICLLIGLYLIKRSSMYDSINDMDEYDWFEEQREKPVIPKHTGSEINKFTNNGKPICIYCRHQMEFVDYIQIPVGIVFARRIIMSCPKCGGIAVTLATPDFSGTSSARHFTMWSRKDKQEDFLARTKFATPDKMFNLVTGQT